MLLSQASVKANEINRELMGQSMMQRLVIALFCTLISISATVGNAAGNAAGNTAGDTTEGANGSFAVTAPPACVNNLGETVTFENRPEARNKLAAGMARRDSQGVPVIYRFGYENAPPALQQFIDLHECAHHQTGDIDRPHPPRNSPAHMMNESIADCIAILRIRDGDTDGKTVMDAAVLALTADMATVGFPATTIESRVSNIKNCFEKPMNASAFLSEILEYRGLK